MELHLMMSTTSTHLSSLYFLQPRVATFAAQGITMAHYMEGAAYTVGPTGNISIRNSSMLRNFGGEVLCDVTVEQIIIENGRAVGVLVRTFVYSLWVLG